MSSSLAVSLARVRTPASAALIALLLARPLVAAGLPFRLVTAEAARLRTPPNGDHLVVPAGPAG